MIILLLIACTPLPWSDASMWAGAEGSWEWILDSDSLPESPPDVHYLGIDGEDSSGSYVSTAADAGTQVWCYLSVGTVEEYRSDYQDFLDLDAAEIAAGREPILGDVYPEWPDERWLDPARYQAFMPLMEARLDVCEAKGFSLVELDNMDAYDNDTGLGVSLVDELAYIQALVQAIDSRGMGAIHKGATALVPDLEGIMEALLLEDCVLYDHCEAGGAYLLAGKPVWNAEYPDAWDDEGRDFELEGVCTAAEASGVSTLIKELDLTDRTIVCDAL